MRPTLLPLSALLLGCVEAEPGVFQGFEEVADQWGFVAENARGVCLFDADGDADLDVLFTAIDGLRFYLNRSPGFFIDATDDAGLGGDLGDTPAGCGAADVDGDGDRDLLVTFNLGDTRLFRNDGAAHFVDMSSSFGLDGSGQSSVTWEDVDRDGRLDVLLAGAYGGRTQLLRNVGGRFEDVTPEALLDVQTSWAGVLFDADNDDLPDLFLGTDRGSTEPEDVFLHNDGDFDFSDASASLTDSRNAMGVAVADIDADGFLDLFVANIGHHPLWRNGGDATFIDVSTVVGVSGDDAQTSGWAAFFLDVDDDGRPDLFKTNGGFSLPRGSMDAFERLSREANQLFTATDADPVLGTLPPLADAAASMGLDDPGSALGAAWGDLDGDGRLDLVVANEQGGPLRVHRNRGAFGDGDPGRLRLRLHPLGEDPDGFGTRVRLDACGSVQHGLVSGASALSQGETTLHFGLGGCLEDLSLRVTWPDGEVQESTVRSTQVDVYEGPIHLTQGEL
jgi:hypothetical protein